MLPVTHCLNHNISLLTNSHISKTVVINIEIIFLEHYTIFLEECFVNVSLHLWFSSYSCLFKFGWITGVLKIDFFNFFWTERASSAKRFVSLFDSSAKLFRRATAGSPELLFKHNLILQQRYWKISVKVFLMQKLQT